MKLLTYALALPIQRGVAMSGYLPEADIHIQHIHHRREFFLFDNSPTVPASSSNNTNMPLGICGVCCPN